MFRMGLRVSRSSAGRLLVSYLLSVASFVFEVLFLAFLLYGGSDLEDWMIVSLVVLFRSGFAVMVSGLVMGVRSGRLWVRLLSGCLVYGVPSMMLVDWLTLHSLITPLFTWSNGVLQGFALPPGLRQLLGLSFMAFILDFPRLMLFVAVEGAIARFESK